MANAVRRIDDRHRDNIEKVNVHHFWRPVIGRLKSDPTKRLKELEAENVLLKREIAKVRLDRHFLQEAVRGSSDIYNK